MRAIHSHDPVDLIAEHQLPGAAGLHRFRFQDEVEAILETGATGELPFRPVAFDEVSVLVHWKVESDVTISAPFHAVDQVAGPNDHTAPDEYTIRDWCLCVYPGEIITFVPGAKPAGYWVLRPSVDQRRVVRECAAVPVERALDIGSGPDVFEDAPVVEYQPQVESVGVPVTPAGVTVVQRRIDASAFPPDHAVPLP